MSEIVGGAGRFSATGDGRPHWVEHLRSQHLSVGTYSLGAGTADDQVPHAEDEVYVVTAGTARFSGVSVVGSVVPGSVVFVAAGEEHRFTEVSADFATVVVFAPPESGG